MKKSVMRFSANSAFSKTVAGLLLTVSTLFPEYANSSVNDNMSDPVVLRPVTSAYTVEFGSSHICDTYLTPLHYRGWHTAINFQRFQAMRFNPSDWIMRLNAGLRLERAQNPTHNATMWDIGLHASWAMMRRWKLPQSVTLAVGGSTSIDGGACYLNRNGNNPVTAKAAWTVNLSAMATYSMKLGRLPVTFSWQPDLPVAGIFFSPDYGELYYEIYLGDHSNLVHAAWWGTRFVFDNLVCADLRFGATALRLGYRNHLLSSKVNNIITRLTTHAFVIGISGEWLSLSPSHPANEAYKTISAYY